jgi:hypothetical protein
MGAMFYLAMDACKGRLLGQRPMICEPLEFLLLVNTVELALFTWSSLKLVSGMQNQYSGVSLLSLWCSLCHLHAVQAVH